MVVLRRAVTPCNYGVDGEGKKTSIPKDHVHARLSGDIKAIFAFSKVSE